MMEAMSEECAEEENMDLAGRGQDTMEGKVCDPWYCLKSLLEFPETKLWRHSAWEMVYS